MLMANDGGIGHQRRRLDRGGKHQAIAILVMVDEPKGNKSTYGFATGGWVSAPVAGRVVQRIAPLLAMQPNFNPPDDKVNSYWAGAEGRTKAAQAARENAQTKEAVRAASF